MLESTVNLYHIMGNVNVVEPKKAKYFTSTTGVRQTKKDKEQLAKERQGKINSATKENKTRLALTQSRPYTDKETGELVIDPYTKDLIISSDSAMSHLIAFSCITRYALDRHFRIAYGEYRKKVKATELRKEWTDLRDTLSRKCANSIVAISIGVGVKGYVYLRFIITNEDEEKVKRLAISLDKYIDRTFKFYTKVLKPMDYPKELLARKYCNGAADTIDDIICLMPEELWQVMRAGLSLPYTQRTFRNAKARSVIAEGAKKTNKDRIHGNTSPLYSFQKMFVEKDKKLYTRNDFLPKVDDDNEPEF
jgi:hypothetical protein